MGHNRLSRLPATKPWEEVAALIASPAASEEIFRTAAKAAERSFGAAADDPVYVEAVRLLVGLSASGHSRNWVASLRELGLAVPETPNLPDLIQSVSRRLDGVAHSSSASSDLGEIARRALVEAVVYRIGDEMPGLFSTGRDDLRIAVSKYAQPRGFAALARSFFVRMTSETLSYWLDRELGAHVGAGRRFEDIAAREAFGTALDQYSWEATRIIHEFCEGWYARAIHDGGNALDTRILPFSAVALKKIASELQRKRGADE